jgi:hypothetical protein
MSSLVGGAPASEDSSALSSPKIRIVVSPSGLFMSRLPDSVDRIKLASTVWSNKGDRDRQVSLIFLEVAHVIGDERG